jgi:signal transduction histidine kinase
MLESSGYKVREAADGRQALETARLHKPDLIISDALMPVMDGFQLCRKVKGDKNLNDILFILYTATYTDEKDEGLSLEMGADKFIRKPVEPDKFIKIIQGVIGGVEKGKIKPRKAAIENEKEVCKLYSERLVKKLEKKMLDLEREINQRKRIEEERKKLEAQLQQAQKMEAVGTLAGGIAHDFNNLLTVIIGNAQLALMNVIKDESLRKEIEEIKKSGDKAASLTRQLLAFSRKQIIKPDVLDLNEEINETEKILKRMIGEDIEFQTVLEPELWKVYADSGQIDQVIINMVVNARDAMPQGGKLTIETANADLDESYFREHGIRETPGHYVMLAISDTGSGMDKETQEHIFEPFFTTKKVGEGTGLGLSTVYGIVKQSNGFVWIYSEPGKGTTFKVYLPKMKGDAEPEKKEQTPVDDLSPSLSGQKPKLCIINKLLCLA